MNNDIHDVSVVTPCYKSELLVGRTIDSLLNAGVRRENIYIVEDGVYDNTGEVVSQYNGINHIKYKDNKGAPYARNLGLREVKTEYVMFIDSDDFVSEDLVLGLVQEARDKKCGMTFGPWRFDGDDIPQGKLRQPPCLRPEDWVFNWINNECVPTCSVLWKTSLIVEIGGWDENLKKNQDGELAIRGLISTSSIAVSTQGYSTYWQHKSENRVSNSGYKNRLFSAEILYSRIVEWLETVCNRSSFERQLGKYCRKVSWLCYEEGEMSDAQKWSSRALTLGYEKKGYNRSTNIAANVVGIKIAILLKNIYRQVNAGYNFK